jgi:hypothetical protein
MQAPVNKHGWDIFFFQYSYHEVQELLLISVKFYNVIKLLVQNDYSNIRLRLIILLFIRSERVRRVAISATSDISRPDIDRSL